VNTDLTPEQIRKYREEGFLKIDGFLSAHELADWRAVVISAAEARNERIPGFNDNGVTGNEYYDRVFKQRVNLWRTSPSVKKLVFEKKIAAMAAELEDLDAVRLWHDQALFKGPWANPTSWHIDDPYWSFYTRHATTIWIALDDTTIKNGALYFLPGAHREATYDNVRIGENIGSLFDVYEGWKDREPVCVEMKAGDASFHNGLAPHAAGPNMTPHPRRAFAIIYMPDGATFNGLRNVLPESLYQSLKLGDVLDHDEFNPIIYRRTAATAE
jgi:ectoine hydroxylase-related dioxygenase (phytanoyl-CoA dioxygenase family)